MSPSSAPPASSQVSAAPSGSGIVATSSVLPTDSSMPSVAGSPLPLRVLESGFSAFTTGGLDYAAFGAIVANPNPDGWKASRVLLHVDFYDPDDTIAGTTDVIVTIPPGGTAAIGGEAFGAGSARRMEVVIPDDLDAFVRGGPMAAPVSLRAIETTQRDGLNVTTGRVLNRTGVSQGSVELTAIYRDRAGDIIGGAGGGAASLPAGGEASFEIVDSAPYPEIARTEVFWVAVP